MEGLGRSEESMAKGHWLAAAWAAGAIMVAAGFAPPRTAVVDASIVFNDCVKKKDLERQTLEETRTLETRYRDLEKRHAALTQELKNLAEPEAQEPLLVERFTLELRMKRVKERDMPAVLRKRLERIESIRADIEKEVEKYAVANDLDLVLEKAFVLEGGPEGFRLPIVHFAKPEIDITKEITLRVNDLYRAR
jgi:Skp family chaperone for outer membrane proteins